MIINDPLTGTSMRVDDQGRALGLSTTESRLARLTRRGDTYAFSTGPLQIAADTDTWISRFLLTEATRNMHFVHIVTTWWPDVDGTPLFTKVVTDNGAPTAAATEGGLLNLNFTTAKTANATTWLWDGTAGGMTGNDPTLTGIDQGIVLPGRTWDNVDGSIIFGSNSPSNSVVRSASAGWYSSAFTAYLLDETEEL